MASVVSTIRVCMDNFQTVDITDPRWMPSRIALTECWRHLHTGLQDEVSWAPPPGIHFDDVVHCSSWNRLLDVRFAGSAMPPPGTVPRLSRINNKTEGIVSHSKGF